MSTPNHENLNEREEDLDPVDVRSILQRNAEALRSNEKPIRIPQGLSKRTREFIMLMLLFSVFWIGIVVLMNNPLSCLFGLIGYVVFSLGITWVYWGIMSDL